MALLRRLEKRILVPLPTQEAREEMIKKLITPSMSDSISYSSFASKLEVSEYGCLILFFRVIVVAI